MKSFLIFAITFVFLTFCYLPTQAQSAPDPELLIGEWKLDMSPQDPNDDNFAMMEIKKVKDATFSGTFYRPGVKIREGQLNTQTGVLYGALLSGDNSGDYHSTFYYQDGKLHGTTHAINRGFLSVWTAVRAN